MREAIYKRAVLFALFPLSFSPAFVFAQALVNINTAGIAELKTLNGIGDVKAQAIIDYRNGHGPFQKIEDVKNVSGIGEATYSNIKDFITVGIASVPEEVGSTSSSTTASSAHYISDTAASQKKYEKIEISLSAGRDRLGSVGSPLEFIAETNLEYRKGSIFTWNFGDGSNKDGDIVTHTYDYPGDYVVVLSVVMPQGRAISRTNVKIIEPEVSLVAATPERVGLKNGSKYEINLFGKGLMHGNDVFVFPQDTIILPGQSISFSSKVTGLKPNSIHEISILTVGESRNEFEIMAKAEAYKAKRISEINDQLVALESQMARLSYENQPSAPTVESPENFPHPALAIDVIKEENRDKAGGWLGLVKRFFLRTDR